MDQRATLQEVKALIQSTQPVIGIETNEEERVRDLVYRAARELNLPFFDWTVTRGLRSAEQGAIANTEDPLVCLQCIKDHEGDGVYLLKDFVQHLDRPVIVRQFVRRRNGWPSWEQHCAGVPRDLGLTGTQP
ncbi:MAG: hypothetical protein HC902_00535 [Calothrix sp. SM1_5_4]|nr:hypothetical protein [Calothrix sp. SM1_5_4]